MSKKAKFISIISVIIAAVFILETFISATAPGQGGQTSDIQLPDGFYRVVRSAPTANELLPLTQGELAIAFNAPGVNGKGAQNQTALVLHTEPEVPLRLANAPVGQNDDDQLTIAIELEESAKAALRELTSRPDPTEVTIVIDNALMSWHKVREPILDGKVKISCCESSCPHLLAHLQKRHKAM